MITALENWQPASQPAPLRAGEVHLWRAPLVPTPELSATLSTDEWLRAERFHFAGDRDHFIAARGLQRTILGEYLDCDPAELHFHAGEHGKPELLDAHTSLRFNLSHSDGLMLLAVTHAREIGVDLEFMRTNVPFETLADHYFDPEDAWDLRLLPAEERAWKFYDVWTCTEARLKAHGVGLANGFQVVEPDRWSLLKLTPAAGYAAALAVEGGDFQLECWSWQK
jgi:4'-phosphopantetheinyl transferase